MPGAFDMRNTGYKPVIAIMAAVFLVLLAGTWAVGSPVSRGTVPPTSRRSGLIRSPNPIDTSGNLVVAGKVRGGRHFRGVVPYNSVTDFGAEVPSSSLDSFMRRSVGLEDIGHYTGAQRPYYSLSRTVTTTRPGQPGVFRPPGSRIVGRTRGKTTLQAVSGQPALSAPKTASAIATLGRSSDAGRDYLGLSASRYRVPAYNRPMSRTIGELEDRVDTYTQARGQPPVDSSQTQGEYMKRFESELKQFHERATVLEQNLKIKGDSLQPFAEKKPDEVQRLGAEKQEALVGESMTFDVYEQMKRQINVLQEGAGFQYPVAVEPAGEVVTDENKTGEEGSQLKGLSDIDVSVRADTLLAEHKSFASFSEDKFNQHMRAAERYLKAGKYYRAADSYTLASVYKPDDPLAYAGRSHALFAAGEYMSSALFLARALEIFPEYVRFKVDIVAMVGDRDTLENRIADVKQWLKTSEVFELQFLLGYVYYQMGRPAPAKEMIDAAYEKMPDAPALITLKNAIDVASKR